ncbi:hypothetical protein CsatB_030064 [Cannabis sativa]|uniref:zinc finger BED domain-containing protein RICESLEEPER 1-like n=1 Tax=Cannabis sativa TaxID=3483 RepID=UPI0029C9BF89|nr:zinc finger BED domain-containing protein RICESLEEPER 1-like [Cannabis sativa]
MSSQMNSNFGGVEFVTSEEVESSDRIDETQSGETTNKKRRRSPAWDYFTLQTIDNVLKAVFNHCGSRIISFKYVLCPHDAPALTEAVSSSMSEWIIEDKVSTVTLDNASTNDAMIPLLKQKFDPSCFILNGELLHMRCCAHILNLIIRDGLSVIGDSIDKIRDSIAYWSGTPKWYEKFEENACHLGVTSTEKLSLDCVTRWNSTYLMIKTALLYKTVFERAKLRDRKYKCLPSEDDWIRA